MINYLIEQSKKIISFSLGSTIIISLTAMIFAWLKGSSLSKSIFDFNYIMGSIIIIYGLLSFFAPINLRKSTRVVDYSNAADVLKEVKEERAEKALENICWGICNIVFIGLIEIIFRNLIK